MNIRRLAPIALLALLPVPASAYTAPTYEQVAVDSLRLAPPALVRIATRHQEELVKGSLTPLATEGGSGHLAHPRGSAEEKVREQTERVIELINGRSPFEKVAYELGVLTHYVTDLNNPLNAGDGDPRIEKVRKDFESYVARKLPKFGLSFKGHRSPALASGDVEGFAREVSSRSANMAAHLTRSYFPGGQMVSSRSFDDRHTAFGIASLAYQNAVGDCARLYVHIWRRVNGDLQGTPFYGEQKGATAQRREGVFRW